ncbi:MAG TPA: 50S ribosomal protein L40e [Nitrososphaeraceae archaeon]|nr:50S ribosomal protein L40e [Nitrososphaeraceae archaeon]HYZ50570.1 50S ribosomal protein L40e [Nitrososphaeraceae archaeon]
MPITDTVKKQIAQQRRLYFKICFKCGAKNPISSERCRKCRSNHMRLKNRTLGVKK